MTNLPVTKRKAFAYITQGDRLLIFSHPFAPEAGLQVPAGSIEPHEEPAAAALREATEETDLTESDSVTLTPAAIAYREIARWLIGAQMADLTRTTDDTWIVRLIRPGGQFYTPRCIVRLLVEMLAPYKGRVYDPCCGSGGMFVQSEKFCDD